MQAVHDLVDNRLLKFPLDKLDKLQIPAKGIKLLHEKIRSAMKKKVT